MKNMFQMRPCFQYYFGETRWNFQKLAEIDKSEEKKERHEVIKQQAQKLGPTKAREALFS